MSYAAMNEAIAAGRNDDDDLSGMLDPWRTTAFADESITHTEGIRRATRKSLYDQFANTNIREDHTLHDLREPCWHPPHDVRPRAGDPSAMVAAYDHGPVDDDIPTASSPTSQAWRRWLTAHRATCLRCRLAAAAARVTATATTSGTCDFGPEIPANDCYFRWLLHSIRTGFEPTMIGEPRPSRVKNHMPVYDDYAVTCKHMRKIEALGHPIFSEGSWASPRNSIPLLTVVREKHRVKAAASGTVAKGRVAIDCKRSGLNEQLAEWPFRYETIESAVHLLSDDGGNWKWKLDLSSFFLYLSAGPKLKPYLWVSDPRRESTWRGRGKPSLDWRRVRDERRRRRQRLPRWRQLQVCGFGIKPLPAYASTLSGECCRYIRFFGVQKVTMMVDDAFGVNDTKAGASRDMAIAEDVFGALGLDVNDKREGPDQDMSFIGIMIAADGWLYVEQDRQRLLYTWLVSVLERGRCTYDELDSQLGKMSWYCHVAHGAVTYMRRMWDTKKTFDADVTYEQPIDDGFRADAAWWLARIADEDLRGSRIIFPSEDMRPVVIKSDGGGDGTWCCV